MENRPRCRSRLCTALYLSFLAFTRPLLVKRLHTRCFADNYLQALTECRLKNPLLQYFYRVITW